MGWPGKKRHTIKSDSTGEIVDVEPEEAEWSLDVLESLFDFNFVQPGKIKQLRAALDVKLKDADKQIMKLRLDTSIGLFIIISFVILLLRLYRENEN